MPEQHKAKVGEAVGPPKGEFCQAVGTYGERFRHGHCFNKATSRVHCIDGKERDFCDEDAKLVKGDG